METKVKNFIFNVKSGKRSNFFDEKNEKIVKKSHTFLLFSFFSMYIATNTPNPLTPNPPTFISLFLMVFQQ